MAKDSKAIVLADGENKTLEISGKDCSRSLRMASVLCPGIGVEAIWEGRGPCGVRDWSARIASLALSQLTVRLRDSF